MRSSRLFTIGVARSCAEIWESVPGLSSDCQHPSAEGVRISSGLTADAILWSGQSAGCELVVFVLYPHTLGVVDGEKGVGSVLVVK